MPFSSSGSSRPTPNNNICIYNLTRLLAWSALPVIGLILFDSVVAFLFLSSPLRVGAEFCGLSSYFPGLLDKMMTSKKLNEQRRRHNAGEDDIMIENNNDIDTLSTIMEDITIANNIAQLTMSMGSRHSHSSAILPDSYNARNSLFEFSSSQSIPPYYSVDESTQENYGVENKHFYGPFKEIRSSLDYNYHGNYSKSRQEFQDKILEKLLGGTTFQDSTNGRVCKTPTEPWIVFTAGVMGSGKSHTMKQLASKGLFPLESYIVGDPDEIRSHFPEYHLYSNLSPKRAGELTHKEAGYLTEILTEAAMQRGHNVLVDGSLWDADWYQEYFKLLRKKYKKLRIAILHITAPREAVFERAAKRAEDTGRVVPLETLEMSLKQVPISVKKLAPMADFFCELDNSPTLGEVTMKTEGITWESFRDNWAQACPSVPGQIG
mmetsp:Transcript_34978/g.62974  ORF Transcript_34978/g.62974 Transcript_34978/m.62974 type:complete len:434 (-) Transcript_34978:192-1493(-)